MTDSGRKSDAKMLRIRWQDTALYLLDNRDRYTRNAILREFRNAIRDEFNGKASNKFINFDPLREGYVTPVLDERYAVVWYLHEDQKAADVSAIVPFTGDLTQKAGLKDYLQRVVKHESQGQILLP